MTAVVVRLPDTVPPTVRLLMSTSATLAPLVIVTAPPKSLPALVSVMSAGAPTLVAASVVAPVTVATPVSLIAPPLEVTFSAPVAVVVPRMMPPVPSTKLTLTPLLLTTPMKLLPALVRVMLPTPAATVATPVTVRAPSCVTLPPLLLAFNVPVTVP